MEYVKAHLEDKFSNVVFTDEYSIELFRNVQRVFVFKGETNPQKCKPNPNYTILVWGVISRRGKIAFEFIDGTIKKENYLDLLKRNFPKKADDKFGKNKWRFQHDNAPPHKAELVRSWMAINMPHTI
jgi:hypothetical protein